MRNTGWMTRGILFAVITIATPPPPVPFGPGDEWVPVPRVQFAREGVERRLHWASKLAPDHHLIRVGQPPPPPVRRALPAPVFSTRVATGGGSPNLR